jgi:hypothetical protein
MGGYSTIKILYYGACWPTNIGNAFIDYGSIYTIKTAAPEAKVFFASELPRWLYKIHREDMDKSIDLAEQMDIDFVVISGMTLCDELIETEGPILTRLSKRGVRIVFNGCGGATYKKKEVDNFTRFLENIKLSGFISRDEVSYNNYKDCCSRSWNGIDCAFFLSEAFSPASLIIKDYVVCNFDAMEEPKIGNTKKIIRTHHSCFQNFPNTITNMETILTIGTRKPFMKIVKHNANNIYFKHKDTLMSDIPDDYLNLYANAYAVYSDRVHACIGALSFDNLARLYSTSPRARLFERVGLGKIREKLVKSDRNKLNIEKEKQISFLKEILTEA